MTHAVVSAVAGYVPDRVLSNFDLEKMMDTNDEWIRTRTGIQERRIMPANQAVAEIGVQTVTQLLDKSGINPEDIDLLICATCTPDYVIPGSANTICWRSGLTNAFGFDLNAACSGFVYALFTASQFIETGRYNKIIVIGAEKLSSYVDYGDRRTSILFGDGGGGVLLEAKYGVYGIIDAVLKGDGEGCRMLRVSAGGSLHPVTPERLAKKENTIYQDGKSVFKRAVLGMANTIKELSDRNNLSFEDIDWLVPHQANERILRAVAGHLHFPMDRVMMNIHKYGNTSAGTIPLCLWEYESELKKGDDIILTAFGGGFTWGSLYLKWAY